MPKPDEDHALPSKKAFIISGCPVKFQVLFPTLSSWTFLSLPYLLQHLECLFLCKAPQVVVYGFPQSNGESLSYLSLPGEAFIFGLPQCCPLCYDLKPPQALCSPCYLTMALSQGCLNTSFFFAQICSLQSLLISP